MQQNDYILLYYNSETKYLVMYGTGKVFDCHKGQIRFTENLQFGDVVKSSKGYEFCILKPTIGDLALRVKRKNTIIYPKEASRILYELGIGPGMNICEFGTGSGAFTLILSFYVGSSGTIVSYDVDPEYQQNAMENIKRFYPGFLDRVTFKLYDEHFDQSVKSMKDSFDAVFVDIPEPWTIIPQLRIIVKTGARIGFLSPTIEQVNKTFEAFEQNGFENKICLELFERTMKIKQGRSRPSDRMLGHTAYIYFASKVDHCIDNKNSKERAKEYKLHYNGLEKNEIDENRQIFFLND